jgi:hypothetical protein
MVGPAKVADHPGKRLPPLRPGAVMRLGERKRKPQRPCLQIFTPKALHSKAQGQRRSRATLGWDAT